MASIGSLQDLARQHHIPAAIHAAFAYLQVLAPDTMALATEGFAEKILLNGNSLFALHQAYVGKPVSAARLESHRLYIDVQYMLSGSEHILWAPQPGLSPDTEYNPDSDIIFYKPAAVSTLWLSCGMAAIFYPQDAHAPGISCGQSGLVKKIVVKIKL